MHNDEFSWHPIIPSHLGDCGMHLRRGGPQGTTYAAVTVFEEQPWLAIFNLQQDTTKVRSVPCDSEIEAIQMVECWLEGMLTSL